MSLTSNIETIDGTAVVTATGELDLATASILQARLDEAARLQPRLLVLDLSGLTFMDSTGLRILLAADAAARREARRLAVVRGPDPVHRVFLIALLDKRLDLVDDITAALALGGTAP